MATTGAHLPVIGNLQVTYAGKEHPEIPKNDEEKEEEEKKEQSNVAKLTKAASFLAGLELGTLRRVNQPRPGDVYHRPQTTSLAKQPRPLGLLPDRGTRLNALRELTKILSPAPPPVSHSAPTTQFIRRAGRGGGGGANEITQNVHPNSVQQDKEGANDGTSDIHLRDDLISATVSGKPSNPGASKPSVISNSPEHSFRFPKKDNIDSITYQIPESHSTPFPFKDQTDDHEYMDTLAKCNIKEYGLSDSRIPAGMRRTRTLPGASLHGYSSGSRIPAVQLSPGKKKAKFGRVAHNRSASLEYVTFTGQLHLCSRYLTADIRDALEYEPCERCRLRGGRCARCKALRTGGGYIILDETELTDDEKLRRFGRRYGFGGGRRSKYGETEETGGRRRRGRSNKDDSLLGVDGGHSDSAEGVGNEDGGGGRDRGRGGHGWGNLGGDGRAGGGGDGGRDLDTDGRGGRLGSAYDRGQRRSTGGGGVGDGDDDGGRGFHESSGRSRLGSALQGRRGMDGQLESGGDGFDSGRQSSTSHRAISRMTGSRPGSVLDGRPGSSMRRGRRDIEHRERTRKMGNTEEGRVRVGHHGQDGNGSDSEDEDGRRRRRRRKDEGEEEGSDREKHDYDRTKFQYSREGEEEKEDNIYRGDLMRFRSKRDNVKALQCTLKELQGIDPLDYLAKYCIIDQEKLPHYRRVFDNVDRDEDDEIDIPELDFALKAVNYDLISDAEMSYVHSVLELAGRYKLNFRLFSLIAALSEKVVALEDMVKRLINKMDFEALEVKMKKCKELFYLLADAESSSEHEGGVVTTSSLAVELQAGGLTPEHVEYVVGRLNHEGRGIVEFLDYLTYVPLFVEIHDSISGNPLDFSRTK